MIRGGVIDKNLPLILAGASVQRVKERFNGSVAEGSVLHPREYGKVRDKGTGGGVRIGIRACPCVLSVT